jgi:hypothetical protein
MKRDTLLKNKIIDVKLPSGEAVKARGLKRGEVVELYNAPGDNEAKGLALARHILTHCLLNDDESRMFSDDEAALIEQLDAGDAAAVVQAVQRASGMNAAEADAKKA